MSLSPVATEYRCTSCGAATTTHTNPFTAKPRIIQCGTCLAFAAEMYFHNPLKRASYQKASLRRAGGSLERAGQLLERGRNKEAAEQLLDAGVRLKELP